MRKKWSNEKVDEALCGRNITRGFDSDQIPAPSVTKLEWVCDVCKHHWKTTCDSILNLGSGCPSCSGNIEMTITSAQERLNSTKRSIDVVRLGHGKQNKERRGCFRCRVCSHQWDMILSNLFGKKQGCPRCGKSGRYTESWFTSAPGRKQLPGKIYLMELTNGNETFLKVGITKRDIRSRFTTSVPYHKTTLLDLNTTLYDAFLLEQKILREFKRYQPQQRFGGSRECFPVQYKNQIQRLINEAIHTD